MLTPPISHLELLALVNDRDQQLGGTRIREKRELAASLALFHYWLGKGWFNKRFTTHPFFNPKALGLETDPFMRQALISHVAELLFNMQHVRGVENVVQRIAKGQQIADDVAELAGAALLQRAGIEFEFVAPTNKKGADYDVEARLGGERVCFEMKGKVVDPSVSTVFKTIKEAENQVPADTPNVIVIQPPNDWMITEKGYDALNEGVEEYFRKGDRFARVIIHADEWRTAREVGVSAPMAVVNRKCLPVIHPKPAVPFPGAVAGTKWLEETGQHWVLLSDLVASQADLHKKELLQASLNEKIQQEQQAQKKPLRLS